VSDISNEEEKTVKNLNQEDLNVVSYCKRENEKVEFDPNLRPVSTMMT